MTVLPRLTPLEFLCALDTAPPHRTLYLRGERCGYSVYRITMSDGSIYVGLTCRQIAARAAQHLCVDTRLDWPWLDLRSISRGGTPQIVERIESGCHARVTCIRSGMTEHQATKFETRQILALPPEFRLNRKIPR